MNRIRGLILTTSAMILTCSFLVSSAVADSCWKINGEDQSFVDNINAERADHGLGSLVIDPELSKVASVHTDEMADIRDIYHSSRATFKERVTNWNVLGENVGVGFNPEGLHERFMRSTRHRRNILAGDWARIGVGTEHRHDRIWVTVMFARERDPGTTFEMEDC